jgi:hypothetical protein
MQLLELLGMQALWTSTSRSPAENVGVVSITAVKLAFMQTDVVYFSSASRSNLLVQDA